MKRTGVKPISYVKANAVDLIALLKILALGRRQVEEGRTVPADEVFRRLRARSHPGGGRPFGHTPG